jgi:hypothetical protein
VYLKIAYHLAQEARLGQSEFRIPAIFGDKLFDFQTSAVKVAAHHLNKRGGVVIGDVVELGVPVVEVAHIGGLECTALQLESQHDVAGIERHHVA